MHAIHAARIVRRKFIGASFRLGTLPAQQLSPLYLSSMKHWVYAFPFTRNNAESNGGIAGGGSELCG
jgi:hypothetical protein